MTESPAVVQITATDLDTGERTYTDVPAGDYFLLCTPPCRVESVEYTDGTVCVILTGRAVQS